MNIEEIIKGTRKEIREYLINKNGDVAGISCGTVIDQLDAASEGFTILFWTDGGETPYWSHDPRPNGQIKPINVFIREE